MKGKRAKKEAEKKAEKAAMVEKRRVQNEDYLKGNSKGGAKGGKTGGPNANNKKSENRGNPDGESRGRQLSGTQPTTEEGAVVKDAPVNEGEDDESAAPALDANANEEEAEEVRRLLQEENIKMLEPEETESLTVLDGLTGRPLPTDILQFAVPVCAPYGALQKFKYKVKLIPGTMKKGKSVKTAINHFLTNVNGHTPPSTTPAQNVDGTNAVGLSGAELREAEAALEIRERDLIKMVKDEEAINAMIGKSKVSAPGVEASKKKGPSGKGRK